MHSRGRHNPPDQLRARGNLSYIQFVKLVQRMWNDAHPDIPLVPTGDQSVAKYPAIYYGLDLRKTHSAEPKPRYREQLQDEEGNAYVVSAQRFQNIIKFTAVTEASPELTDQIIEAFEDFMLEYTPVFKELGVSEFVYARRYPDSEENRPGAAVVRRSIAYMVTTEKVRHLKVEKIKQIIIDARTWIEDMDRPIKGPRISLGGEYVPRTQKTLSGSDYTEFWISEYNDEDGRNLLMPNTAFAVGDIVYLVPRVGNLLPGLYEIRNIIGNPWDVSIRYEISRVEWERTEEGYIKVSETPEPYEPDADAEGVAIYISDTNVLSKITDQFSGVTEEDDDSEPESP